MKAVDPFVFYLAIFVLAIFVGYYVVWSVTPALHTPLMALIYAISSVIIVGALIAAAPALTRTAAERLKGAGGLAVGLGSSQHFRRLSRHAAHAGHVQEEREEVT